MRVSGSALPMEPKSDRDVFRHWVGASACYVEVGRHVSFLKGIRMNTLVSALVTFVVVILVLYLVNILPIDGRAKQIVGVIVTIIGIISLLKYLTVF